MSTLVIVVGSLFILALCISPRIVVSGISSAIYTAIICGTISIAVDGPIVGWFIGLVYVIVLLNRISANAHLSEDYEGV